MGVTHTNSKPYAFTTAAMAAALEETTVSYEDLAEIEREFDDVETEIIRHQINLTAPLYTRRAETVSQIPNFWPLVLEQAPPDIDQYIQPSDSALLLSSLTNLSVSHFQINKNDDDATMPMKEGTDPRSVSIRFEFSENEYFTDTTLEKRFWYRKTRSGWAGLVSEPVRIGWRKGKDLTGGLLDLVCEAWEEEHKAQNGISNLGGEKGKEAATMTTTAALPEKQKALKRKIEHTGMGGLSFFAWFGFIGRRVSEVESIAAGRVERAKRERRIRKERGLSVDMETEEDDDDDDDDEEDETEGVDMSMEIFPDGDDLAVAITEDLWPGAIKYFTQAQEQDALSDDDFESDDAEEEEEDDDEQEPGSPDDDSAASPQRPSKKQKT